MRRWDPLKALQGVALASWAGLFWWLIVSGRTALYLSSRTSWVVPVGAVILTIAAIGRLFSARSVSVHRLELKDARGLALVMFPIVIILALPPAALGSYAAQRRSSFVGSGIVTDVEDIESGELTLATIAGAQSSPEAMHALQKRAGSEVSFIGFVTRDSDMAADEFVLTRFLVSCCVADALSVQARVVGAPLGEFAEDDWVRVTGKLYPLGREVLVDATEVVGVDRPDHPYLNP